MSGMPVIHLTPKWSDAIMVDPRREPLCVVRIDSGGELSGTLAFHVDDRPYPISFSLPCRIGDPDGDFDEHGRCLAIRRWGLQRLGPGTWQVVPSVVEPSIGLHAYVVLCDVPEPAPFAPPSPVGQDGEGTT